MQTKRPSIEQKEGKEAHYSPFLYARKPPSYLTVLQFHLEVTNDNSFPNAGHLSRSRLLWKSRVDSNTNKAKHLFFISSPITKLLPKLHVIHFKCPYISIKLI